MNTAVVNPVGGEVCNDPNNRSWCLFTDDVGLRDWIEYTRSIWVFGSRNLDHLNSENKAGVVDARNYIWSPHTSIPPLPSEGYVPLDQIFLFARDKLHVKYLFWSYTYHAGSGAFNYDDALAVMRKHPSF